MLVVLIWCCLCFVFFFGNEKFKILGILIWIWFLVNFWDLTDLKALRRTIRVRIADSLFFRLITFVTLDFIRIFRSTSVCCLVRRVLTMFRVLCNLGQAAPRVNPHKYYNISVKIWRLLGSHGSLVSPWFGLFSTWIFQISRFLFQSSFSIFSIFQFGFFEFQFNFQIFKKMFFFFDFLNSKYFYYLLAWWMNRLLDYKKLAFQVL